jgi:hypothetical protein
MPIKPKKTRLILIPLDSGNPNLTVQVFQHDGTTVYVPLGKTTKVPEWVIENNPNFQKYEVNQ